MNTSKFPMVEIYESLISGFCVFIDSTMPGVARVLPVSFSVSGEEASTLERASTIRIELKLSV
jgi:hypothetical protein